MKDYELRKLIENVQNTNYIFGQRSTESIREASYYTMFADSEKAENKLLKYIKKNYKWKVCICKE